MNTSKKIGITTFWETNDNYGQLIQCWALQQYLRKQGHEPYLIRYTLHQPKKNKVKRIKAYIKKCIADILYYIGVVRLCHLQYKLRSWTTTDFYSHRFKQFRKKYITVSPKIYASLTELRTDPPLADVYITGSDQVWNYSMEMKHFPVYFLQFGNDKTKRVSYAASIGHAEFPEELQPDVKRYLDKFDAISIRETSAVQMFKQLGFDVTPVIDPTLLLQADDYAKLLGCETEKECIFIYSMNYSTRDDIPFDTIKQYAANKNIPIVVTPGTGWVFASELFEGVEYNYATLPQWLRFISQSKLVVTASFHGIVFSILYHSPFIYTPLNGHFADANSRILDLLSSLGLEQRVVVDEKSFHKAVDSNIDWKIVDDKLEELRMQSSEFLKNAIE